MFPNPCHPYLLAAILGGLLVGALVAGLVVRSRLRSAWRRQLHRDARTRDVLEERLATAQDTITDLQERMAERQGAVDQWQERCNVMRVRVAELETVLDQERKQSEEKLALLHDARKLLQSEFQVLAQRIFEEQGGQLVERHQTAFHYLIDPLRDQIERFKRRVEDVYDKETRDRVALQVEIQNLKSLNQRIGQEALNLTRALKGDSKTRGNWGEVVLARVLEAAGLQKGREFDTQVALRDRDGRRFMPDAVVRLPEGRDVVIDAKVSLNAYEAYQRSEAAVERDLHLERHVQSMRRHIQSLSAKNYTDLVGLCSLEFTLMFVPIEAAFLAAVEKDGALFTDALENNVVVVTPSTLLVTLRVIAHMWRQVYQSRHALEIAQRAGALYDKFVGFVEALQEVGQMLDRARGAYRTAHDRLVSGSGNLVRRTEALKALGAKAAKSLPPALIEKAGEAQSDADTDD